MTDKNTKDSSSNSSNTTPKDGNKAIAPKTIRNSEDSRTTNVGAKQGGGTTKGSA